MRNDKINNAKLGVFVIVAMTLFIAGIYYIGNVKIVRHLRLF